MVKQSGGEGAAKMRKISLGIATVLLGTMLYIMIGVALAAAG